MVDDLANVGGREVVGMRMNGPGLANGYLGRAGYIRRIGCWCNNAGAPAGELPVDLCKQ